jgi:hypothetical protein
MHKLRFMTLVNKKPAEVEQQIRTLQAMRLQCRSARSWNLPKCLVSPPVFCQYGINFEVGWRARESREMACEEFYAYSFGA